MHLVYTQKFCTTIVSNCSWVLQLSQKEIRQWLLRNSYNPALWFKQIKRTVSFDVTTRFNPIQQSTAIYNSHIFNGRNTTINVTKRSTNTFLVYRGIFVLSLRKAVFLH